MSNKLYFFRRHLKVQNSQLPQDCQANTGVFGVLGISWLVWFVIQPKFSPCLWKSDCVNWITAQIVLRSPGCLILRIIIGQGASRSQRRRGLRC